jgi:hypothetical protein
LLRENFSVFELRGFQVAHDLAIGALDLGRLRHALIVAAQLGLQLVALLDGAFALQGHGIDFAFDLNVYRIIRMGTLG